MKNVFVFVALVVLAVSPVEAQVIPNQYIVVLNDNVPNAAAAAQALAARQGVQLGHVYEHALKGFSFAGPPVAARALARSPLVAYVEADPDEPLPDRPGIVLNPLAEKLRDAVAEAGTTISLSDTRLAMPATERGILGNGTWMGGRTVVMTCGRRSIT